MPRISKCHHRWEHTNLGVLHCDAILLKIYAYNTVYVNTLHVLCMLSFATFSLVSRPKSSRLWSGTHGCQLRRTCFASRQFGLGTNAQLHVPSFECSSSSVHRATVAMEGLLVLLETWHSCLDTLHFDARGSRSMSLPHFLLELLRL